MAEVTIDDVKTLLLDNFLLRKQNAELQAALAKATAGAVLVDNKSDPPGEGEEGGPGDGGAA